MSKGERARNMQGEAASMGETIPGTQAESGVWVVSKAIRAKLLRVSKQMGDACSFAFFKDYSPCGWKVDRRVS